MAVFKDSISLQIGARDKASGAIRGVQGELSGLAGAVAKGNLLARAGEEAFKRLGQAIGALKDATFTAARVEVLANVLDLVGKNAGNTSTELEKNTRKLTDLGIATKEALQLQIRFIQSQLDLKDSAKVARAAQDLAVVAGLNSSDTAVRLTEAIVKQRPILLKQFGIIANLNDIYGTLAEKLNKSVEELTDTEKKTAFLNVILTKSATVAGAYERAMENVGKRLTSLPRHFQNAQVAVGRHFLPAMGFAIDATEIFLKTLNFVFGEREDKGDFTERIAAEFITFAEKIETLNKRLVTGAINLENFKDKLDDILRGLDTEEIDLSTEMAQAQVSDLTRMMEQGLITAQELEKFTFAITDFPFEGAEEFAADFAILRQEEQDAAEERFQAARDTANMLILQRGILKDINRELEAARALGTPSVGDLEELLDEEFERQRIAKESFFGSFKDLFDQQDEEFLDEVSAPLLEKLQNQVSEANELFESMEDARQDRLVSMAEEIVGIAQGTVTGVVDEWIFGENRLADVFRAMARDFVSFFARSVFDSLTGAGQFGPSGLVGGIVDILGSIFDRPSNDAVAMEQGRHYAEFFSRGVLDELNGFTPTPNIQGEFGGGIGASAGITIINPILTNEFIRSIRSGLENLISERTLKVPGSRVVTLRRGPVGV